MPFIKFPIFFAEDEFEKKENLGLAVNHTQGMISINTRQIIGYNAMDNGNTLLRMSNGDAYEIPLNEEEFEDLLTETEILVSMSELNEN
jgi:competence transcription factor ComK